MSHYAVFDVVSENRVTEPMTRQEAEAACERLGGRAKGYMVDYVAERASVEEGEAPDNGPGLFD